MDAITKRLAAFQRVGGAYAYVTFWDEERAEYIGPGYVRISEYVEVTLPPLSQSTVIEQQLQQLDKAEAAVRNEFQQKLDQITDARQKLMALSAPATEGGDL